MSEHIVVLLLENRSFDHMLGYLSLEGGRDEVDGLRAGMANHHGGRRYPIHHLASTYFPDERWDPEHTAAATDRQIDDGAMDGYSGSVRGSPKWARRLRSPNHVMAEIRSSASVSTNSP